jgi:folate-binding protein YgfZ
MTKTASPDYSSVRDGGAGLFDLSSRGRIQVSGGEVVMFLNGLITNDMKTLAVNSWMPAAFPNVQGRLLAGVRVIHRDDGFLIDTESATREAVLKLLERFTMAGDFRVADVTGETACLSLQGKKAADMLRAALGDEAAQVEHQQVATVRIENGNTVNVIRATHTAEDGFDLFIDAKAVFDLRDLLTGAGAQAVGPEVLESLRIEAGIARYGIDMDETNVVSETNLDDAVSFTKGCYVGQEIIARIKYRGHVAKKLTGLIVDGEPALESGASILSADEKEIGRVTSSTFSPQLKQTIALGYVKYDFLPPGTPVKIISSEKEFSAVVAELPFIRGSWYQKSEPPAVAGG